MIKNSNERIKHWCHHYHISLVLVLSFSSLIDLTPWWCLPPFVLSALYNYYCDYYFDVDVLLLLFIVVVNNVVVCLCLSIAVVLQYHILLYLVPLMHWICLVIVILYPCHRYRCLWCICISSTTHHLFL